MFNNKPNILTNKHKLDILANKHKYTLLLCLKQLNIKLPKYIWYIIYDVILKITEKHYYYCLVKLTKRIPVVHSFITYDIHLHDYSNLSFKTNKYVFDFIKKTYLHMVCYKTEIKPLDVIILSTEFIQYLHKNLPIDLQFIVLNNNPPVSTEIKCKIDDKFCMFLRGRFVYRFVYTFK